MQESVCSKSRDIRRIHHCHLSFEIKCEHCFPEVCWRFLMLLYHAKSTTVQKWMSRQEIKQPWINWFGLFLMHFPCSHLLHTTPYHPLPLLYAVYVLVHMICEQLLQQWGKRKGDQPAHVERHGCSLMWLQFGSPEPNEVLWSSAAPSPIAYTPAAHILPLLHHSGSLRRCSWIPLGTQKEKKRKKTVSVIGTWVWVRSPLQLPTHTFAHSSLTTDQHSALTLACYKNVRTAEIGPGIM